MHFYVVSFRNLSILDESAQKQRFYFGRKAAAVKSWRKLKTDGSDDLEYAELYIVKISPGKGNFIHWLNEHSMGLFECHYSGRWITTRLDKDGVLLSVPT